MTSSQWRRETSAWASPRGTTIVQSSDRPRVQVAGAEKAYWRGASPGGSDGGQKGLRDVINRLGTEELARLRIGVGRPPGRMDSAAYVLSRFRPEEREVIDDAILRAADGVELWLREGLDAAMNRVNAPAGSVDS